MKIQRTLGWATLMLAVAGMAAAVAAGTKPANPQISPEVSRKMTDEQAVAAATDNFYAALNTMFTGNGGPIKELWSRARDITYMGPNGLYLVGWEKIEQEWNQQAANKLGGRVTPQKIHIVVGTDIAVLHCIESGENLINGKKETVQIRSSTVFRKENGAWKIIAHQTDPLGYMNSPK